MGKLTVSMAMFHSYASLPEANREPQGSNESNGTYGDFNGDRMGKPTHDLEMAFEKNIR